MGVWNPGPGATSGNDTFTGNNNAESANGLGGDDLLIGAGGADTLQGGIGHDTLDGGAGHDRLTGGDGDDVMAGGAGNDTLDGGTGYDKAYYTFAAATAGVAFNLSPAVAGGTFTLNAGINGTDRITAVDVITVLGSGHDDTLTGSVLDDQLAGGNGSDFINSGASQNDVIDGDADGISGDDGSVDTWIANLTTAANVVFDGRLAGTQVGTRYHLEATNTYLLNLERFEVTSGSGSDRLMGADRDDILSGGVGNDTIWGSGGDDTLDGGDGIDTLGYVEAASAVQITLNGTAPATAVLASETDTVSGFENVTGSAFADRLTGDAGNNFLTGREGSDTLEGGDGNDVLNDALAFIPEFGIWLGDDLAAEEISGGAGNDTWITALGQSTDDIVIDVASFAESDTFVTLVDGTRIRNVEAIQVYSGIGNDSLTGGNFTDVLVAQAGSDTLIGGDGIDHIDGGAGADTMFGGGSDDFLYVFLGTDVVAGDRFDGGIGVSDALIYQDDAPVDFSQVTITGVEELFASQVGQTYTFRTAQVDAFSLAFQPNFGTVNLSTAGAASFNGTNVHVGAFNLHNAGNNLNFAGATGYAATINGGDGDDTITGSDAWGMNVFGNAGRDRVTGGSGIDIIRGGTGRDTLNGGAGDDIIRIESAASVVANEIYDGGAGNDRLYYDGASAVDLSAVTLTGIESFQMSDGSFAPTFTAKQLNAFTGEVYGGLTRLSTGGTVDFAGTFVQLVSLTMSAQATKLSLVGADAGSSVNAVHGGNGNDVVALGAIAATVNGNAGSDDLTGSNLVDTLNGGDGDDKLRGGLAGDRMVGGTGNDQYYVDAAADLTIEAVNGGNDTVFTQIDWTLSAHTEILRMQGTANLAGTGNDVGNKIFGNSGANLIQGLLGADTLDGKDGADTLVGGEGNDTLTGGGQADVFRFAAANTGADRITDFQKSVDRFDLSDGSFTNAVVNGADTILTHGGGTIRVEGINNLTLAQWNALVVPGGSSSAVPADAFNDTGAPAVRLHSLAFGDWLLA